MSALEVLTEARELIAKYGWVKGWLFRTAKGSLTNSRDACRKEPGGFCTFGALIYVADNDERVWRPAEEALERVMPKELVEKSGIHRAIAFWNDMKGRTTEEVIDLFDRAIELESKR